MVCLLGTWWSIPKYDLLCFMINLKASDCQCRLLGVEELSHDIVSGLLDGTQVHVQVGEGVVLQGGTIGTIRVADPLVNVVVSVGEVLTRCTLIAHNRLIDTWRTCLSSRRISSSSFCIVLSMSRPP